MDEILATGPTNDIAALIKALLDTDSLPRAAFLLCEQIPLRIIEDEERSDLLRFVRLQDLEDAEIARIIGASTSGRIFHYDVELRSDFELRWEKVRGTYNVVYLGNPRTLPGLTKDTKTLAVLKKDDNPRPYYLFGRVLTGSNLQEMSMREKPDEKGKFYAEVRIPRLLDYPAPSKRKNRPRICLTVREYTNEIGQVELFRFQDVEDGE